MVITQLGKEGAERIKTVRKSCCVFIACKNRMTRVKAVHNHLAVLNFCFFRLKIFNFANGNIGVFKLVYLILKIIKPVFLFRLIHIKSRKLFSKALHFFIKNAVFL